MSTKSNNKKRIAEEIDIIASAAEGSSPTIKKKSVQEASAVDEQIR